jgi:hypothetical protein
MSYEDYTRKFPNHQAIPQNGRCPYCCIVGNLEGHDCRDSDAANPQADDVTWACRFHPTDWFHEVGCPHREWTKEQLVDALIAKKKFELERARAAPVPPTIPPVEDEYAMWALAWRDYAIKLERRLAESAANAARWGEEADRQESIRDHFEEENTRLRQQLADTQKMVKSKCLANGNCADERDSELCTLCGCPLWNGRPSS